MSTPMRARRRTDADDAKRHFKASAARIGFCGHTHRPALYSLSAAAKVTPFTPNSAEPIVLSSQRRWLATMGAVGQPRDGNPAAAYGLMDLTSNTLRFVRVPYDIHLAAEKIRNAGLPEALAARLYRGK